MKEKRSKLIALLLIFIMAITLGACGDKNEEAAAAADTGAKTEEPEKEGPEVVESISDIDGGDTDDEPLQIESVNLFDDGSVMIVPLDDLKKNAETNNELKADGGVYPFADSGKVKKIYLVKFGDEGYRTIIALMDDGSLSALSAQELITDHITIVMDNLTGRDNFVSVNQTETEGAFGVVGVTEDGEEVELDFSLNF